MQASCKHLPSSGGYIDSFYSHSIKQWQVPERSVQHTSGQYTSHMFMETISTRFLTSKQQSLEDGNSSIYQHGSKSALGILDDVTMTQYTRTTCASVLWNMTCLETPTDMWLQRRALHNVMKEMKIPNNEVYKYKTIQNSKAEASN
jgi:hypothetical protein